jgi:hypothetical protein
VWAEHSIWPQDAGFQPALKLETLALALKSEILISMHCYHAGDMSTMYIFRFVDVCNGHINGR